MLVRRVPVDANPVSPLWLCLVIITTEEVLIIILPTTLGESLSSPQSRPSSRFSFSFAPLTRKCGELAKVYSFNHLQVSTEAPSFPTLPRFNRLGDVPAQHHSCIATTPDNLFPLPLPSDCYSDIALHGYRNSMLPA